MIEYGCFKTRTVYLDIDYIKGIENVSHKKRRGTLLWVASRGGVSPPTICPGGTVRYQPTDLSVGSWAAILRSGGTFGLHIFYIGVGA